MCQGIVSSEIVHYVMFRKFLSPFLLKCLMMAPLFLSVIVDTYRRGCSETIEASTQSNVRINTQEQCSMVNGTRCGTQPKSPVRIPRTNLQAYNHCCLCLVLELKCCSLLLERLTAYLYYIHSILRYQCSVHYAMYTCLILFLQCSKA